MNRTTYCSVNTTVHCRISQQANNNNAHGALVDGGSNGGLLGDDVRILEHVPNGYVNITGVAGNKLPNHKLAQAAALVNTMEDGPIIGIMLQYANYGVRQKCTPRDRWNTLEWSLMTSHVTPEENNALLHPRDVLSLFTCVMDYLASTCKSQWIRRWRNIPMYS